MSRRSPPPTAVIVPPSIAPARSIRIQRDLHAVDDEDAQAERVDDRDRLREPVDESVEDEGGERRQQDRDQDATILRRATGPLEIRTLVVDQPPPAAVIIARKKTPITS
jgi:hypothetical protein